MERKININIGQYYASREPVEIYTLLGSCVAVCLYDWKNRIGGMNHILLPGKPDLKRYDATARYGINAMEMLINEIMKLGGDRKRLVAKAFGGGHVIPVISRENSVGQKITAFVKEFLRKESIELIGQDMGGTDIRKVYFHTDTGVAYLKRLPSSRFYEIAAKEKRGIKTIKRRLEKDNKTEWLND